MATLPIKVIAVFAMKETFTPEEIQSMTDRECELLERLATNIQEGLY